MDMRKREQHASEESLLLVLRALGADIQTPDAAPRVLRARHEEIARQVMEPVIVAWNGRVPVRARRLNQRVTLVLEDGSTSEWPPRKPLPYGYHRLHAERDAAAHRSLIISAPLKAHFPLSGNTWGVFTPVYSLRSQRGFEAGDLTEFESVIDWMHGLGGRVAATLPLLACFLEEPFEPSPYSPVSRIFWNEFFMDLERVAEFSSLGVKPSGLSVSSVVDYRATMAVKRQALEGMAKSFFSAASEVRRAGFEKFLNSTPEVIRYARFRAITDRLKVGWPAWPERLRRGEIRRGDWDEETERYHLYVQWNVQDQIHHLAGKTRECGGALYLDLPLGLNGASYDTWRYPHLFVKGMDGGAPPDPVFTTGQNWAFPPMHPQAVRTDHYDYTIRYIRNHLKLARLLRIDHVMGLHRLYWIPAGLQGDKGVYVRYPAEEMYAILSIESHRCGAGIVGENLGMVPPEVNVSMDRHNIRQLYVVQYETVVEGAGGLRPPPRGSIASLNTHDMFPFEAFLKGMDITDRMKLGFLNARKLQLSGRIA